MRSLKFATQVVTPLFLAGANQEGDGAYELRPPSFKALMRWWFRAAHGGHLDELKKREAELFGSTDRASVFNLRIYVKEKIEWDMFRKSEFNTLQGIQYLGFSLDTGQDRQRTYVFPDSSFELQLSFTPPHQVKIKKL
jgi:CRISPR type III-B/RAMP module RAMP protein Cmr1